MRRTIFLLATIGTAFLLAGGVAVVSTAGPGKPSVAGAQTSGTENPQTETVRGVFSVQWGDPQPGSGAEARTEHVLIDDRGRERKLLLDRRDTESVGGPLAFNGKRVRVKGTRVSDEPERVDVQEIEFERPADAARARSKVRSGELAAQALPSGSKPWVTIGCRFKGSTRPLKPVGYYQGLTGSPEPGMDHYWKELSFDNINLAGSQVGGPAQFWYDLPRRKSYYMNRSTPNLTKISNDCTAAADRDVNFPDFYGINLVLSDSIGCCAWGGNRTLTRDGRTKNYAVTWLPQTFASGHDWIAHEMGHGFGLPHSSGSYSATYDSEWDVMSGAGLCTPPHATYECIADHTVSHHKDLLGWVPSGRRYLAASGSDQSITIERLGQPSSVSGYLMAKIPIGGSATKFYTVEARRFAGYDGHVNGRIPGEAIVIHKVDTTLSDRNARVVDADNDGDPNDQGAMWTSGETFTDAASGITVQVTGATASGYGVRITLR